MSETKNINSQERDPELFDVYELGYHILPTVPEADLSSKVEEIYELLKEHGAEIIMEGEPKLIKLAYTMIVPKGGHNEKYDEAYFGWVKFEAPKSEIPNLQKELKLNQNILRFILFKTVREDTRAQVSLKDLGIKTEEDNEQTQAEQVVQEQEAEEQEKTEA